MGSPKVIPPLIVLAIFVVGWIRTWIPISIKALNWKNCALAC